MYKTIELSGRRIGEGEPAFIIAEIGVNHNGDTEMAFRLIDMAVEAGADCVKFQAFTTELCESKNALKPDYFSGRDRGASKAELSRKWELDRRQFEEIIRYCRDKGTVFLSMVADFRALDMLLEAGAEALKVGSSDTVNVPLLERVGRTRLPVILSTGISTMRDVELAVEVLNDNGTTGLALMQCTSQYPAPPGEVNLNVMREYEKRFGCPAGLSDHTRGIHIPVAAVAIGAKMVEKHFTLSRNLPGVDHAASIEPAEMREMVLNIRDVEAALGSDAKEVQPSEREHLLTMRKSLVMARDAAAGEVLSREDVLVKRPGGGLLPQDIARVAGKRLKKALAEDDMLTWDALE